jgi:hypothetical protein
VAAVGPAEQDRPLVADEPAAALGEDRRPAGEARALLLAIAGGEPSDAAVVRKHGAEDRGATGADRLGCGSEGEANRVKEGGDGGVSEESFEMKHFRVVFVLIGDRAGLSWAAEVAGDGKNEGNGSCRGGWVYNPTWPGGQNGNPDLVAKG